MGADEVLSHYGSILLRLHFETAAAARVPVTNGVDEDLDVLLKGKSTSKKAASSVPTAGYQFLCVV